MLYIVCTAVLGEPNERVLGIHCGFMDIQYGEAEVTMFKPGIALGSISVLNNILDSAVK